VRTAPIRTHDGLLTFVRECTGPALLQVCPGNVLAEAVEKDDQEFEAMIPSIEFYVALLPVKVDMQQLQRDVGLAPRLLYHNVWAIRDGRVIESASPFSLSGGLLALLGGHSSDARDQKFYSWVRAAFPDVATEGRRLPLEAGIPLWGGRALHEYVRSGDRGAIVRVVTGDVDARWISRSEAQERAQLEARFRIPARLAIVGSRDELRSYFPSELCDRGVPGYWAVVDGDVSAYKNMARFDEWEGVREITDWVDHNVKRHLAELERQRRHRESEPAAETHAFRANGICARCGASLEFVEHAAIPCSEGPAMQVRDVSESTECCQCSCAPDCDDDGACCNCHSMD
jgi:hypothetical protein